MDLKLEETIFEGAMMRLCTTNTFFIAMSGIVNVAGCSTGTGVAPHRQSPPPASSKPKIRIVQNPQSPAAATAKTPVVVRDDEIVKCEGSDPASCGYKPRENITDILQIRGILPGEPVSSSKNREVMAEVLARFHPQVQRFLNALPIVTSRSARTAYSHTISYLVSDNDFLYIAVNPDWDVMAKESPYWDCCYSKPSYRMQPTDPTFSDRFKSSLLTHEMLHQVEEWRAIDMDAFDAAVGAWYSALVYGVPAVDSNYTKHTLWWNIYGKPGNPGTAIDWMSRVGSGHYADAEKGSEEFAYIGERLADDPESCGPEIPESLLRFYDGVLAPDILERARAAQK